MIKLSPHQTRRLRLRSQRLDLQNPVDDLPPAQLLHQVLGVQAQELPAAELSIRARGSGLTAAQVHDARQQGDTAWIWAMRGTLHLVDTADALWLVPFLGPRNSLADRRRFRQLGWDEAAAQTGMNLLREALAGGEGLTRPEIISRLAEHGLPSEGQAPIHLIFRAAQEGLLCSGPDRDGTPTYMLLEKWLGKLEPLSQLEALKRMAARYLEAYAPAGVDDFIRWSGLKKGEARQAWEQLEGQITPVEIPGGTGWLLKSQLAWLDDPLDKTPVLRLLPRYDTYLLGYAGRELAVPKPYARRVHPGGGLIHPVLLVDGLAQANWKTKRRKRILEVIVEPFDSLASDLMPLLEAEVQDVGRFMGEEAALTLTT